MGTSNWNMILLKAWDKILCWSWGLTATEWVVVMELWNGSEKAEGTGKMSRKLTEITQRLYCDTFIEEQEYSGTTKHFCS